MKLLAAPRRIVHGARMVHESTGWLFGLAVLVLVGLAAGALAYGDRGLAFMGSGLLLVILALCYAEGAPEPEQRPITTVASTIDYDRLVADKLHTRRHELAKAKTLGLYREGQEL